MSTLKAGGGLQEQSSCPALAGPGLPSEHNFLYFLTTTNAEKRTLVHIPPLASLPQLKEGRWGTHLRTPV